MCKYVHIYVQIYTHLCIICTINREKQKERKNYRVTSIVEIFGYTDDIWCKSVKAFVIDINKNKYGYQICNIGHMIFISEFDVANIKVNMPTKTKDGASRYLRTIMLTHTPTDVSETIISLTTAAGKTKMRLYKQRET